MPRQEVITRTLYKFEELSDKAKEKARDWWRTCEDETFGQCYPNFTQDEFVTIGGLLGIEFDYHRVVPMGGEKFARNEPDIWWSLHTQGSGACFDGRYSYAKGSPKLLRAHIGGESDGDKALLAIVDSLADVQKRNLYQLRARIKHSGNYTHEHSCDIEVARTTGTGYESGVAEEDAKQIGEAMRDFMRWMHAYINAEYDYAMSAENVDESIRINDYEFTEEGRIA